MASRVQLAQESFARTDILVAKLRTQQWRTAAGDLRTEHAILEILEHRRGPRQIPLPFENDGSDDVEQSEMEPPPSL